MQACRLRQWLMKSSWTMFPRVVRAVRKFRTGSRIVAEVLHAARRFDRDSYVHHAEMRDTWPIWEIGGKARQLESLGALFSVADQLG